MSLYVCNFTIYFQSAHYTIILMHLLKYSSTSCPKHAPLSLNWANPNILRKWWCATQNFWFFFKSRDFCLAKSIFLPTRRNSHVSNTSLKSDSSFFLSFSWKSMGNFTWRYLFEYLSWNHASWIWKRTLTFQRNI